ncbi:unnamed protein product, partial [Ectocarpus sp. 8 AP-2014]
GSDGAAAAAAVAGYASSSPLSGAGASPSSPATAASTGGGAAARAKAKAMAAAAARAAATPAWMSEMMSLEEEAGLTCMVCHEGYQCKPRAVLGVYVYAKPVLGKDLHELEGDFLLDPADLPAATEAGAGGGGG